MEAPTSNNSFPFRLDRVGFYGRTLSEYVKMFDLADISASSFVAEAKNKYGIHAVGCDPLFGEDLKTLVERGEADIEYVLQRVSRIPAYYNWDFYRSIMVLKEYRIQALRQVISDYHIGIIERRDIKAELPMLPFDDKSFI